MGILGYPYYKDTNPSFALACGLFAEKIPQLAKALRENEFIHFDAHCWNILTDGKRFLIGDQGLALLKSFDLSTEERSFFNKHRSYDEACLSLFFVYSTISHLLGEEEWFRFIQSKGDSLTIEPYKSILAPFLEITFIVSDFFESLKEDKNFTYPSELIESKLKKS